ncbi:hypothetical protein IAT38_002995 [Cryptococcus sp. DSM 104549]
MSHIVDFGAPPPRSSSSKPSTLGTPVQPDASVPLREKLANRSSEAGDDEEEDMLVDTDTDGDMSDEEEDQVVIHVEVRQKPYSHLRDLPIIQIVSQYIEENIANIELGCVLSGWDEIDMLRDHVERVWVEEGLTGVESVKVTDADIQVHVYKSSLDTMLEEFTADLDGDDENEEKVSAASVRSLPSLELDGVWDTLVYSDDIKARLLNYIYSTILFSECDIDFNVIAWNRVILLHGPPGTGKTSLCRALAQKIAIRLSSKYRHGKIIEINSHSLFSKWFSESGKLVQKLFETVTNMVEDESGFVVVMIDEVESLTAARAGAMRGNEPSDSLRVVNALLTQLDKLRTRKNVLVMTTSNLVDAIDEAFISRVDLQEHVPLPPPRAIYSILSGCLREIIFKGLVKKCRILDWKAAEEAKKARKWGGAGEEPLEGRRERRVGAALVDLAEKAHSIELSGRTLRKLPVLAHARYLSNSAGEHRPQKVEKWIEAMERVVGVEASKKVQHAVTPQAPSAGHQGQNGHGHARTASVEKREVGTMVGTKVRGEHGEHGVHGQ